MLQGTRISRGCRGCRAEDGKCVSVWILFGAVHYMHWNVFCEAEPDGDGVCLLQLFLWSIGECAGGLGPVRLRWTRKGTSIWLARVDGVPLTNSFQQGIGGSFAAEFAPDGKTLLFSTLLGGAVFGSSDRPLGMQVAPDGTMFLAGVADAQDFPFTPDAVSHPTYPGSNLYLYAAAIGPSRNGFQFSTVLGMGSLTATAMDANGKFYVAGSFTQGSIPFKNPVATESPVGAYIMELDSTGALINSTAFGGHNVSQVPNGMGVDAAGNLYVAGVPNGIQFAS